MRKIICDHCTHPILKDGVHVNIKRFREIKYNPEKEMFLHKKCLISAIELYSVKELFVEKGD